MPKNKRNNGIEFQGLQKTNRNGFRGFQLNFGDCKKNKRELNFVDSKHIVELDFGGSENRRGLNS